MSGGGREKEVCACFLLLLQLAKYLPACLLDRQYSEAGEHLPSRKACRYVFCLPYSWDVVGGTLPWSHEFEDAAILWRYKWSVFTGVSCSVLVS